MNSVKIAVLVILTVSLIYEIICAELSRAWRKKPIPENVADIYDAEKYVKWCRYSDERGRVGMISYIFMFCVTVVLFSTDVLSWVYGLIGIGNEFFRQTVFIALFSVFTWVLDLVPSYMTGMKIEGKYGFNKSSIGTFAADKLKELILGIILTVGLNSLGLFLGDAIGTGLPTFIVAYLVFAVVMVSVSLFSLQFQKLFNKFTKLEDGTLKDRIYSLFKANGYKIKSIYVMNASKRTTKANAFCTGLGKQKKIALYDNLIEKYPEEEITAVFAHELGHDRHHDTVILTLINLLSLIPFFAAVALMCMTDGFSVAYGFEGSNMAFIIIALSSVILEPLMNLVMIPANAVSRGCEYRADRFATDAGYGKELRSTLKKLTLDNFSNVNPHPFLVATEYSHPTVS